MLKMMKQTSTSCFYNFQHVFCGKSSLTVFRKLSLQTPDILAVGRMKKTTELNHFSSERIIIWCIGKYKSVYLKKVQIVYELYGNKLNQILIQVVGKHYITHKNTKCSKIFMNKKVFSFVFIKSNFLCCNMTFVFVGLHYRLIRSVFRCLCS